jgi:hypothetical protein
MNVENSREKKVEQVFGQNPQLDEIWMTSDDLAFSKEDKAEGHASHLADNKVEHYLKNQPEVIVENEILALSVKPLTAKVQEIEDLVELESLLSLETEGLKRKGALTAINAQINKLTAAIEVEGEEEVVAEEEEVKE